MKKIHRLHTLRRMAGISLLELMIAVLIGTGVIAGGLALYANTMDSTAFLNASSRVQENGRFAVEHIARTLRMGGYDDPVTTGVTAIVPAVEGKNNSSPLGITGKTVKSSTDAISIAYEGTTGIVDCQGVEFVTTHTNDNIWVSNTYAISDANELICRSVESDGTVRAAAVIAEGIEDLDLKYGVDTDSDGVANQYVYFNAVGALGGWANVVSAKISVLVNSVEPVWRRTLHSCESCSVFNPTASNLLRGEFHATVRIRNT